MRRHRPRSPGRTAHRPAAGFGVLATVCMLAFAAGLLVMAFHSLWRGSSRNLFSLQEHRQLMNLCRSGEAEALFKVQTQLEQGNAEWLDRCTMGPGAGTKPVPLKYTGDFVRQMAADPRFIQYSITDVTVSAAQGLNESAGMSGLVGALDFSVTATVQRHAPAHRASLTLTERHAFWFSDAPTPFHHVGRHIEIIPTPAATFLEYD